MTKYKAKKTAYKGRTFDSKAEATHAELLDINPQVQAWFPQAPVYLGEDHPWWRADFLVIMNDGRIEINEVKGVQTQGWRLIRKLIPKYSPYPVRVIRKGATLEIIEPDLSEPESRGYDSGT